MQMRQRVLHDQAENVTARMKRGTVPLSLLVLSTGGPSSESGDVVEIAYVRGTQEEPAIQYSSLVRPEDRNIPSKLELIAPHHLGTAPGIRQVSYQLGVIIGTIPTIVYPWHFSNEGMASFYLNDVTVETPSDEEKEFCEELSRQAGTRGRALSDAVFLYRAMRLARQGEQA
jgi:hypothetical protein